MSGAGLVGRRHREGPADGTEADHGQRPGLHRQHRRARASAVEYSLLIAGIAAVLVLAIFAFGGPVKELFTDTCDELDAQPTVSATCP